MGEWWRFFQYIEGYSRALEGPADPGPLPEKASDQFIEVIQ